ncbi:MAG: photosystem II stability/assembly factor-like uncharacterized protein [Arenicella sp.]|jgi:photosystem II stability/assembly factor-like uncharacterized protein
MRKLIILALCFCTIGLMAQRKKKDSETETKKEDKSKLKSSVLGGLKFRNIGPAVTSGRVIDFAVNPENPHEFYVATAAGGVWKTVNNGTTFQPLFDSEGSNSIGCVTIDPQNPHTVWVGSGENNGQRSIGYGDGVYKSTDGGKSWKNVGLKKSEHIGSVVVHPDNSEVVFVAAQGPLWSKGGDRGLYKTEDGGKTWKNILEISEHTGINEVILDPRNPDVMYASAWQRRRHVFTFISGGPESAIYKSVDGGENWEKLKTGLPTVDLGRIGLAISPVNPDYIYAIVEASQGKGGFYRSKNRGASFEKMSKYASSGNYYQEIIADPVDVNKVYSMNTWSNVTKDGGKTFVPFGETDKHVDHHAIWINPKNTTHFMIGCDGGIYTTYDDGKTWKFHDNLPITQFYKVALDNDAPFYNVYGGTQDNFSLGGPARTTSGNGITNADWFVTNGGDGFESQVDPKDPNIVYAQSQYGWLVRYDKASGQTTPIQPQPKKGEKAYRWNWDAPLLISPHSNTRLYFAANKLFRSDDRGDTWKAVSEDLTQQIDRNKLTVMDKVWSVDAVAKNASTTIYGNIVALDESPKQENLLYVGTDDGLVQVSENGGDSWSKNSSFVGVPTNTYVNMLLASQHDANVVYGAFNNHKQGDFKPYLLKSSDKGKSWTSIASNLPERGSVYSIAEDHVNPNLLFAGTEFGVFFSVDGGAKWTQLKAGLPTVAIRDIAIQRRENDLVLATFGRGFYVLDDYAPLRELSEELLETEAHIFATKDAWMFIESMPLGIRGKGFQGSDYFMTPNPKVGAVFNYYLKEGLTTAKAKRLKSEKKARKEKQSISYPTYEQMRLEDTEEKPYLIFTVMDSEGKMVRKLKTSASAGMKRMVWDFRYPSTNPIRLKPEVVGPFSSPDQGYLAIPGDYKVSMGKVENGQYTELVSPQPFKVKMLNNATLSAKDRKAVVAFQAKVGELQRMISSTRMTHSNLMKRLKYAKVAVRETPEAPLTLLAEIEKLESQLQKISIALNGDRSLGKRQFETLPSIANRVGIIVYGLWNNTTEPTSTQKENYELAAELFTPVLSQIKQIANTDLPKIENKLNQLGAPYTPNRILNWNKD